MSIYLERHGYSTAVAHSGEDGARMAAEASPDVAVEDVRLPGIDGLEVLKRLRELSPTTAAIMAAAHASVASAVEGRRRGACDYLNKPVDLDELKVVVDKALAHLRLSRELSYLKSRGEADARVSEIVGESAPARALRARIQRIAALE